VSHDPSPQEKPSLGSTKPVLSGRLSPNYKWAVVGMLWFICFFNYADRQSISSVVPVIQDEFGFTDFQMGMIGSAFMYVYAFGSPAAGYIGDRFRRKDLILGGCLFWSVVTAMTGWCSRLGHFLTVRALEGFGETFYFPASLSLVSDYHDRRTRSRALAFHQSSVYIGTIGGGWLGAWFAEKFGWRSGFYFFGISGLVLALALYGFLREPERGEADMAAGDALPEPPLPLAMVAPTIFRSPVALMLMIAFLCANFVATIFLFWTPKFLRDKFGFDLIEAGLKATLYIQLASAVSGPLSGFVSDWLSRRFRGGRVLVQAFGVFAGAGFVVMLATTETLGTLFVAMSIFGFCKGIYDANIFASLYDVIEPRARASATGLMNMVGWAGGALGPMWVGWLSENGPRATINENRSLAFASGGALYVFCGALLIATAIVLVRTSRGPLGGDLKAEAFPSDEP